MCEGHQLPAAGAERPRYGTVPGAEERARAHPMIARIAALAAVQRQVPLPCPAAGSPIPAPTVSPSVSPTGSTTTRRSGSSPSDSLCSPASATASWITLRSNGVIACKPLRDTGPADLLGRPACPGPASSRPAARPVAAHVQHDPAAHAGLPVHRKPGQFLQRFQHLTTGADQFVQGRADDRDHRPVALDVHVDVAVEVRDIEQPFDVVGRDLAFLLQVGRERRRRVRVVWRLPGISGVPCLATAARPRHRRERRRRCAFGKIRMAATSWFWPASPGRSLLAGLTACGRESAPVPAASVVVRPPELSSPVTAITFSSWFS